ncbi:TonB-dependent receptor [Pedobacter ginsengisoli]|uniref:TonB-dependent receptor n=1 Tax=Pedobacter ginsengisoli TaxID=363852 RepID=A0A2D1U2G4_9SPHI|nr:carboxypeptidase-like regulatory domain-containing protein [Pedobacter ginsengisoli]ATP55807.1 TonB-dependent receptor [Pedobacter ginsengisoli]
MKRSHAIFISVITIIFLAFIPRDDSPIEKIISSLESWVQTNPQEKVYLHTDRPYYLVGDTIWFKAYVTIGSKHQLSALSGALYVDLINEEDSVTKSLKLPLTAGMAKGDFVLDDSTSREGNYRIRAYTQWMRNTGSDYFYDQTFSIGNSVVNTVFANIIYEFSESDDNKKIKALIKFTDEKGAPYADKEVTYDLKEGYKIITSGQGKTNAYGQISVNLPLRNAATTQSTYLLTKLNPAKDIIVPKTFPIKPTTKQPDVQFFPEGGCLVNNVKSKLAFKAVGPDGLGMQIKGVIFDNEQNEVAKIESNHLGMGYFSFIPKAGNSYTARIRDSLNSEMIIKLPEQKTEGYVLSVYNSLESIDKQLQADSVLVRINTNQTTLQKGTQQISLIAQAGGTIYAAMDIQVNKTMTSIYIPVKDVPSGILQFTLFSSSGSPLNERIVFIQNNDQLQLKLDEIEKKAHHRRDKVVLQLDAKDAGGKPVVGNFSMSVISEDASPTDEVNERSIFSQLLLNSDIKGYIEKPNYYFHNPSQTTKSDLDILMLTQGYRRFLWSQILDVKQNKPSYKAEKLVNNITGVLTTFNNKPVVNGKVKLVNNKQGLILDTITDQNGRFKFGNLMILNGMQFSLQGRNEKNSKRLNIVVDNMTQPEVTSNLNIGDMNSDIPHLVKVSMENSRKQEQQLEKHAIQSRTQQLQEVKIRASKALGFGNKIKESQADEVFRPDSRMPCKTLRECIEEMKGSRVRFLMTADPECGSLWVPMYQKERFAVIIDDMSIAPCDYQSFFESNSSDVEKIYFSHESKAISIKLMSGVVGRGDGGNAVMAIYTKSGNFRKVQDPSVVTYKPKGYNAVKEFYSPRYDKPEKNDPLADLRTTIYWNPSIIVQKEGKTEISFFNSDQTGNYRVVLEGISSDGQIGRLSYKYSVN